ncbi:MAG: anhydro-N-acetylmuramic acid kinase [Geminicoccaceae bacterium]
MTAPVLTAIGTMSGTSVDAIDLAVVASDGQRIDRLGPHGAFAYRPETRRAILDLVASRREVTAADCRELAAAITADHAEAIERFMAEHGLAGIDLVGFHGQTVLHRPERRFTLQLGDPQVLADRLGIRTVGDLRQADVAAGGQGAPIVPVYHAALAGGLEQPLAFLNVGGVANLTFIDGDSLVAFDVGPGNALLDDWVRRHGADDIDRDGRWSAAGTADAARIAKALALPFFARPWPKSLDRNDFPLAMVDGLGLEDGAATLAELTAAGVEAACRLLPAPPKRWLVTGGGRLNPTIMTALRRRLGVPVEPVEAVGLQGDALEAQAMGFLAIRSLRGLPLTLPTTTGAPRPLTGGALFLPKGR